MEIYSDVMNTSSPMSNVSTTESANLTTYSTSELGYLVVPAGCVVLPTQGFIPWDNPRNIVSLDLTLLVSRIKACYILPALFLVGFPTNCINMVVFYRQGLGERVSLCLFVLSFVDLVYVVNNMLVYGDQFIAQFTGPVAGLGPVFKFVMNHKLNVLFAFGWASMFMSAVLASERCFCILYPLQSKSVLTVRTMAAIIFTSFVVIFGGYFVVVFRFDTVCVYNPITNTTTIELTQMSEFYFQNQELINQLDNVIYGVVLVAFFVAVVVVTTAITAYKLRQVVRWREDTSSSTTSAREVALTRMLVAVSILFAVCYTPKFLLGFICIFVPELDVGRTFHNAFRLFISVTEIFSCINASFNFFIYYRLGSRYRAIFWEMFRCGRDNNNTNTNETTKSQTEISAI